MPTKQEIIAGLSPIMRKSYRVLMANAHELKCVLVWSQAGSYEELELVQPSDLTNEDYMRCRVVLFDGRG